MTRSRPLAIARRPSASRSPPVATPAPADDADDEATAAPRPRRRARAGDTVRLLTHDSFLLSDGVLDAFTEETGIEVEVIQGGDAGTVVNQAILTKGNPQADVLFGIDSTFLVAGPRRGAVRRPRGRGPRRGRRRRCCLDPEHCVTPIDYGDVCLNYDKAYFEEHDLAVPTSLEDLTDPALRATSSWSRTRPPPRRAWRSCWPASRPFGEDGWEAWWSDLRDNGVRGGRRLGGGVLLRRSPAGSAARAIARSSCPTRRARRPRSLFADPPVDEPPTGVIDASCYRQVEGGRDPRRHRARRRRPAS